jgi:hypothetical protein
MAGGVELQTWQLPKTEAYVDLRLLDGGSFIGDLSRVHAGASGKYRMYNWAFHISHLGRHMLWDLGLDEVRAIMHTENLQNCTDVKSVRIGPITHLG